MEDIIRDSIQNGRTQQTETGHYQVPHDVIDPYFKSSCAECGKTGNVQKCGRCGKILYCSKVCQTNAWKRIHKSICRKSTKSVGVLTSDNLFKVKSLQQLANTLKEHEGMGLAIEAAVGQVLMEQPHLVHSATLVDIKAISRVTARRLSRKDPFQQDKVSGCFIIASALSTHGSPAVDAALAETPLFNCIARYYNHYAPTLNNPQPVIDIPLLSAMVNLVHENLPQKVPQDLLTNCSDTTWKAIDACCVFVGEAKRELRNNQNTKKSTSSTATKLNMYKTTSSSSSSSQQEENDEETSTVDQQQSYAAKLKTNVLPELRMLARNLAYVGASPTFGTDVKKMQSIIQADFFLAMDDYDFNSVQVWCTTTQNFIEKCDGMSEIGQTLTQTVHSCTKPKFGGTQLVFKTEPPS